MSTLTYSVDDHGPIPCKLDIPVVKTSMNNFSSQVKPQIASHRKLLCCSMKQPNVLRILNHKDGKYTDTTVKSESVRYLTSSLTPNATLFFAVGGKVLSILEPNTEASGNITVNLTECDFNEELYCAVSGEAGSVCVLGQSHVYEVNIASGKVVSTIDLSPKTHVEFPCFDYCASRKVFVAPAKSAHLDLISGQSRKTILNQVWEPHPESLPSFAHIFKRSFADEKESDILLLTAANRNTELRLWAFNETTKKFTLKEELFLTSSKQENLAFDITLTPSEDYITLSTPLEPFVVVVEMHRSTLKSHRITTWKMPGKVWCNTAYVGKIADSNTKFNYELCIATRCEDGIYRSLLDANKLAGSSNTSSLHPNKNSVTAWFPGSENNSDARNAHITSISSSVDGKTSSSTSDANVAAILRQQAQKFCDQVKNLDGDFLTVQKSATNTMRMFQETRFREEAQLTGKQFAARNKGRISNLSSTQSSGEPVEQGLMTESQREVLQCINTFVKEIEGGSSQAAAAALKALLQKHLKQSVEKAAKDTEKIDIGGTAESNLSSTDQARQFRNSVDTALAKNLLTVVKESHDTMKTSLESLSSVTSTTLVRANNYTSELRSATTRLREEVEDLERAISLLKSGAPVVAVDPNTLVARAVAAAEAGDWKSAFVTALESGDLTVLLTFLESKICQDNISTITHPQLLPVALFLSICLQLSYELNAQPGSIPLRLHLLHLFYVEWDDYLRTIKAEMEKGDRSAGSFDSLKRQLITVYNSLQEVDISLLDRKSKNNHRLVTKLLGSLLKED